MSQSEARDQQPGPENSAELLHRSLALKAFPPLDALDERVLSLLARLASARQLASGDELETSARAPRTLRLVVSGTLVDPQSGARFGAHELAGGPAALTLQDTNAPLIAESEVVLLEFEERVLEALFEDEFSVLEALLRGLGRVLVEQGVRDLELPGSFERPMGLVERVQLLRACPALGTLGIDILADLGIDGELVRLRAGATWESREGECYATLLTGELRDERGASIRAPSLVGWLEVLADRSATRRFVARDACVLMTFDAERFWDRLEDNPEQGLGMVRALARMLRAA